MEDVILKKLGNAFNQFKHSYDIIIIDTGAGIAQSVVSFLLGSDKIVLVITPDPASIADAYAMIKVVRSVNKSIPVILTPNMVNSQEEGDVLRFVLGVRHGGAQCLCDGVGGGLLGEL